MRNNTENPMTASQVEAPDAFTAETFGEFLHRERTMRGISLQDIARETRVHINALRALEADDRANLPAEVFVRGFVRNYAEFLGLSSEEVLNRYTQKSGSLGGGRPGYDAGHLLASQSMAEAKRIWTFKNFLLLVLTGLLIFGGYYFTRKLVYPSVDQGKLLGVVVEEPVVVAPATYDGNKGIEEGPAGAAFPKIGGGVTAALPEEIGSGDHPSAASSQPSSSPGEGQSSPGNPLPEEGLHGFSNPSSSPRSD